MVVAKLGSLMWGYFNSGALTKGKPVAYKCTWNQSYTSRFEFFHKKWENSYQVIFRQYNCYCMHQKIGTLCHHFTKLIWEWAEKKGIHITIAHIPGAKNIEAGKESR